MKIVFSRRFMEPDDQRNLTRLECSGSTLCWAIGPSHLLRSDNAGNTWVDCYFSSPLNIGTNPHRMAFHSAQEGALLAKKGPMAVVYFRTDDGGRTWSQIRRLEDGGYVWAELFALPKKRRLWSLIKQRGRHAFVESFDDKSSSWERTSVSISGEPREIQFADELTGWIVERWNKDSWMEGSPHVDKTTTILHRTKDGGKTWEIICEREFSCLKLLVIDVRTLFMVGEDGIFLSQDGGINWKKTFGDPRVPLLDIHFRGPVGVSIGTEGLISSKIDTLLMVSQDGGKTWREADTPAAEAFVGARMMTWSTGVLASGNALYTFELM